MLVAPCSGRFAGLRVCVGSLSVALVRAPRSFFLLFWWRLVVDEQSLFTSNRISMTPNGCASR